jgi:hypothetical protein
MTPTPCAGSAGASAPSTSSASSTAGCTALFAARLHSHVFCRGLARLEPDYPAGDLNQAWRAFDAQLAALTSEARLAA